MRRLGSCSWWIVVLLVTGCFGDESDGVVVARIAGVRSTYSDFERFVKKNLGENPAALPSQVLSPLFVEFVDELCLARLAWDRGVADRSVSSSEAAEALLADLPRPDLSEVDVRSYHEAHAADLWRPERVVLGQILVQDRRTADRVRAAIEAGVPFESAGVGLEGVVFSGYQDEMTRDDLPAVLAERIFSLDAGQVSEVLEADYGFHIFHVQERRPEEELTFERARDFLEEDLLRSRMGDARRSMVREARLRYNVEFETANLPFELSTPGENE